ncbi:MAG: hypothetical protein AAFX94_13870, partial [Myxococcota bacterium]
MYGAFPKELEGWARIAVFAIRRGMDDSKVRRVFLVGTGSAGTTLGLWLSRRGHRLVGAWNRSSARAEWANEFLPVPVRCGALGELPDCDVVL